MYFYSGLIMPEMPVWLSALALSRVIKFSEPLFISIQSADSPQSLEDHIRRDDELPEISCMHTDREQTA